MGRLSVILLIVAVSGCVNSTTATREDGGGEAGLAPSRVVTRSYEELFLRFPVPAAGVDTALPAAYRALLTPTGEAELVVAAGRGGSHDVAGGGAAPGAPVSKVAVVIEDPDGRGGTHYYLLWHVGAPSAYQRAFEQAGVTGATLADLAFGVTAAGARVDVAWADAPYAVDAVLPPRAPLDADRGDHHYWHDAPHGATVSSFRPRSLEAVPATARVDAPEGSPLAALMGRASVPDARGFWILVDAHGVIGAPADDA